MNSFSLGIIVYNEEQNIGNLLSSISNMTFEPKYLMEIIVVASGCTDRTVEIVKSFVDSRIKLIVEEVRRGKASGINLFLQSAVNEILILQSGDTIASEDTYKKILKQFEDEKIGMVGCRIVPLNSRKSFMGFTSNFFWDVHHLIALKNPKCGELIGFRKLFSKIPEDTVVDEPQIELLIRQKGYNIKYLPEAVVYNKGPESVREFIMRRRNIVAGYLMLSKKTDYRFYKIGKFELLKYAISYPRGSVKEQVWVMLAIFLEAVARFFGWLDYHFKKTNLNIWEIARSTKKLK